MNIASYGGYRSGGFPLVGQDGVLDADKVRRLARYGTIVMHANALHLRPDIVPALRAAGAKRIIPYVTLTHWHLGADFALRPSDTSFNAEWHRAIQSTGGFLPNPLPGYEVDWTNKTTAKALTDLCVMLAGSWLYDGMFLDYCSPDWEPEGSRERATLMTALSDALSDAGGDFFQVVANGIGAQFVQADFLMHEGFPEPFTSFEKALDFHPNRWLKCEDTSERAGRFGYGTALLTGATFCWGPQRPDSPDFDRWLPQFDMDLGEPKGMKYQHASGVWMRWYEGGLVLVNPTQESITVDLIATSCLARIVTVNPMDAVIMERVAGERPA